MRPDTILFHFGDEWGEIDTVLPLIRSIKKSKKLKIIVFIKKDSTFKKREKFQNLYKILKKNSDLIIYPSFFSKKRIINENLKTSLFYDPRKLILLILKIIKKKDSDLGLKWIMDEILKKFNIKYFCNTAGTIVDTYWLNLKDTKYLVVPHAPTFKGGKLHKYRICNLKEHDKSRKKKFNYYRKYPNGSLFFTNDHDEKIFFQKYLPSNFKIIPIGFTRLEKKWIRVIKSEKKNSKKKKQILILLGKANYLGKSELKNKFYDILLMAEKFNYSVKYKFHPKSIFDVKEIINKFSKLNIKESLVSVMSEALDSEVTISTSKTGSCLDSIAVGVPVIEYYSYSNGIEDNMQNEFKINGKIMSLFKYHGLVESLSNKQDLEKFLKKIEYTKNFKKKIVLQQKKALNKIAFNRNKVSEKFLKSF